MLGPVLIVIAVLAGVSILAHFAVPPASAEVPTSKMQSTHPNSADIRFFDADPGLEWPDSGHAWKLADNNCLTRSLLCRNGNLICHGVRRRDESAV